MRKALILISLIMTLFSPLYADIDCTGMPEKELENKDVVVYCWSEFVPEKVYDWSGFRFEDYYGGNAAADSSVCPEGQEGHGMFRQEA